MIPIKYEIIYIIGLIPFYYRYFIQYKASKKAFASINPKNYWALTFLSSMFIGIYGYFIGSTVMIVAHLFSLIYSIYHYQLEVQNGR